MKIACPSCSARYAIPDEKIEGKVAKIRCRKCGASIEADGRTTPATIGLASDGAAADEVAAMSAPDAAESAPDAAPEAAAEVPAGLYSVDLGESDQRNMSLTEIIDAYNDGEITAETYLWADGMADWQPLGEVAEIVDALHAAAEGEGDVAAADAPAAAADADPVVPAAEPEPAAPAPEPAIAAPEPETEPQPAAEAPQPEPEPEPEPAAPFTGGRDESSVLFSLSALTSSHSHAPPSSSGPASVGDDDSGLIDLKALTSQTEASPSSVTAPVTAAIPGIHAPAVVRETNGGKGKLYGIIAAAVVTVLLIVGIVLNQRANAEEARLAAETAEKERVALVAKLEAEKVAAVEKAKREAAEALAAEKAAQAKAQEEADAKAKADAEAKTKQAGVKTKRTKRSTRKKTSTSSKKKSQKTSTSSKKKKSTKKRGKCGCPMGDLQCAIRCAASKKK